MILTIRLALIFALCCCFSGVQRASADSDSLPGDDVVSVAGVAVTRAQLDRTLEGLYEAQTLPQLIDNQLVENALAARDISVSETEISNELARFEQRDPELKTDIKNGGPRVEVIRNQVRRNLAIQKLLTSRVPGPNESQLQTFFATYAVYYGTPTQNRLAMLAISTKARAEQIMAALKVNPDAFNTFVAQQKAKAATDPIAGLSTTNIGYFERPSDFGTARGIPSSWVSPMIKALTTARRGQLLLMQTLTPHDAYLIIKVIDRKEATRPTLNSIREMVATDYKLAQVAQSEIKKNPANPPNLKDNVNAVISALEQINPQTGEPGIKASLRDALIYILQPASSRSLNYLRSHADIHIFDPSMETAVKEYQKNSASDVGSIPSPNE